MTWTTNPAIHDHFDGSAHCVECGGPCRLTGGDLDLTMLVRYLFEEEFYQRRRFGSLVESRLKLLGVNALSARKRCSESNQPPSEA